MGASRIKSTEFIGQRFGRLIILNVRPNKRGSGSKTIATVQCDCGKVKEVYFSNVRKGVTKSCGCLNSQISSERFIALYRDHGLSRHPLYTVWSAMHSRCYNKKDISYCNYGAKGVTICDEWLNDFMTFYNWAINNGWEAGLQIDKDIKGNGKLYAPGSCIFVTRKENGRKKRNNILVTYNGETKALSAWCESLSLKYNTVRKRILSGINPETAFV